MKNKIISIFAIITILLAYTNISIGATQSDVDKLKQQQNDAKNKLDNVKDQKNTAADELSNIKSQINSLESEISSLESKLGELNTSISQKEGEIKQKKEELEQKEELLKKRLIIMYKGGGISYLDVLLGSSNYIEMLSKFSAVNTIA